MASNVIAFPRALANDNSSDRTPPPVSGAGTIIRLPVSADTPAMRFKRAYHEAAIARAAYNLHHARYVAWLQLEKQPGQDWQESPYASEEPFKEMQALVFKMAVTPATTATQLADKRSMIGRVWLKAKGEVYDAMRAGVEIDELRFGKKAA